ncbi:hypothetical protein EII34_11760 [Arachnia propionica]|uniref:Uncharacterized protein n=1 Tax=Arachnia propionica TaxID=1750 RepID=A0A3P1T3H4_9ACTN|nr:hypothetical protein [Arachnia propionica]RRD04052.1 hypothetical protein EII34_11760 [Arachnia propionica]
MSDEGLINPDEFICRSFGLDPEAVEQAGEELARMGLEILRKAHGVDKVWNGLRNVYESPEQEAVYAIMDPATVAAARIREDLLKASRPLLKYAEALQIIKPRLKAVEDDARAFRSRILEEYPGGEGWRVDHEAVATNQDLLARYNQLHRQVVDEITACEDALRLIGLDGAMECLAPSPGLPEEFDKLKEYPWGAPGEPAPRNFFESWWYGARDNVVEFVEGVDALAGYDEYGNHSWENFRNAWAGVGDFAWTHVKVAAGTPQELLSLNPSDEYRSDMNKLITAWGEGAQWDHQTYLEGGNGWHAYEEDPHRAGAKTVTGVIPIFGLGRMIRRVTRGRAPAPAGVHPVLGIVGAGLDRARQPLVRVGQRLRSLGRAGWDQVMGPLDDKLRRLATQVAQGLDQVSGNGWGRAAVAGADVGGGGRSPGRWGSHGLVETVVDEDLARGGSRRSHGGGEDGVPRRAADWSGDAEPPRRPIPEGPDLPEPADPVRRDRHGNPLIVDENGKPLPEDRGDGRSHYASDPEGTFRDTQGKLRSSVDGAKFAEDPYAGDARIVHHHDWTQAPAARDWADAARQAEFKQAASAWEEIRSATRKARAAAKESLEFAREWLARVDPEVDVDSRGYSTLASALDEQLDTPNLTDAEYKALEHHQKLLEDAGKAELKLQKASEWAGDRGGHLTLEDQGRRVILGETGGSPGSHASPGSGTLDQVGISGPDIEPPTKQASRPERYEIAFDENKGGNSPKLGSRGGAQQGTLPYLQDLLSGKGDPRLAERLTALRDAGEHPGFFDALRRGEVVVRYQFVNARPDGTLRAGEFNLGSEVRLRWDGGDTFELITE